MASVRPVGVIFTRAFAPGWSRSREVTGNAGALSLSLSLSREGRSEGNERAGPANPMPGSGAPSLSLVAEPFLLASAR